MLKVILLLALTSLSLNAADHVDPFKGLPAPVQVPAQKPAEATDTSAPPTRPRDRCIKVLPKPGTELKGAAKRPPQIKPTE